MIKAFISEVGGGRTMCSIAECAAQEGRKIAYISTEISDKKVLERVKAFGPKFDKFVVFHKPIGEYGETANSLYKKIQMLSEEFDLICIDSPHLFKNFSLEKLNEVCFNSAMSSCTELWITMQAQKNFGSHSIPMLSAATVKKIEELNPVLKIKQISRRVENSLIPGVSLIEAIDLENKEVKTYNLTNLLNK